MRRSEAIERRRPPPARIRSEQCLVEAKAGPNQKRISSDGLEIREKEALPALKTTLLSEKKYISQPQKHTVRIIRPSIANKLKTSPFFNDSPTSDERILQVSKQREEDAKQRDNTENAGPTNWGIADLRIKYREEKPRHQVHQVALQVKALSENQAIEHNTLVAQPYIPKHPLHTAVLNQLDFELVESLSKARIRASGRRFVNDVHQIWLANLDQLGIHKIKRHDRCDNGAIDAYSSQIQSVAYEHARRPSNAAQVRATGDYILSNYGHKIAFPPQSPLPLLQSFPPDPICMRIVFAERVIQAKSGREFYVFVERQCLNNAEQWRFDFFDPSTNQSITATATPQQLLLSDGRPASKENLKELHPKNTILVHKQLALIYTRNKPIPAYIQIRTLRDTEQNTKQKIQFSLTAVAPHFIQRMLFTSVDVVARLGLSHLPLRDHASWSSRSDNAHVWIELCKQIACTENTLHFAEPTEESHISKNFNFTESADSALALIDTRLQIDSSTDQEIILFDGEPISATNAIFNLEDCSMSSLTMQVCGMAKYVAKVPGTLPIRDTKFTNFAKRNSMERTLLYLNGKVCQDIDNTEAVATFFRGGASSSVLVNMSLALDCLFLSPSQTAFDPGSVPCERYRGEPLCLKIIQKHGRTSIPRTPQESKASDTMAGTIIIQTASAKPLDHESTQEDDGDILTTKIVKPPPRHRRLRQVFEARGFRCKTTVRLLTPDPSIDRKHFNLSRSSITPNKPALMGRITRNSDELCVEQICRVRNVHDYLSVLTATKHRGANDPSFYTLHLNHLSFRALARGGLGTYMKLVNLEKERAEVERKKKELEDKVKRGQAILEARKRGNEMEKKSRDDATATTKNEEFSTYQKAVDSIQDHDDYHTEALDPETFGAVKEALISSDLVNLLADKLGISQLQVQTYARTADSRYAKLSTVESCKESSHPDVPEINLSALTQSLSHSADQQHNGLTDANYVAPLQLAPATGPTWRSFYREKHEDGTTHNSFNETRTQGAKGGQVNTVSPPKTIGFVQPATAINYIPETFTINDKDTMFISDMLSDTVRAMEISAGDVPDERLTVQERLEAQAGTDLMDAKQLLEDQAILGARVGDADKVEEALDQDIFVDIIDSNGNTLLILAAQSNNKRIIKILLRRGANINAQNNIGNTALHYCNEYSYDELAAYLQRKGADDTLLNAKGLTCYEGISLEDYS